MVIEYLITGELVALLLLEAVIAGRWDLDSIPRWANYGTAILITLIWPLVVADIILRLLMNAASRTK